jgi:poly(A) polymerase
VEVTTLRRDVATDGRRATVAFTDRMEEDADRRDFTVNALYATRPGRGARPNGEQGLGDLRARRIRFIGDPHDRIREDYLRILRFFRFHAWYADPAQGMDADGLAASAELADGIDRLAKERIGAEMRKLLAAPDPAPAVAAMARRASCMRVLPGADDRLLPVLVDRLKAVRRPTRCAGWRSLGGTGRTTRCACRGPRRRTLAPARGHGSGAGVRESWAIGTGRGWRATSCCLRGAMPDNRSTLPPKRSSRRGRNAVFPVKAADLMPDSPAPRWARNSSGWKVWIESGFRLTAAELLG